MPTVQTNLSRQKGRKRGRERRSALDRAHDCMERKVKRKNSKNNSRQCAYDQEKSGWYCGWWRLGSFLLLRSIRTFLDLPSFTLLGVIRTPPKLHSIPCNWRWDYHESNPISDCRPLLTPTRTRLMERMLELLNPSLPPFPTYHPPTLSSPSSNLPLHPTLLPCKSEPRVRAASFFCVLGGCPWSMRNAFCLLHVPRRVTSLSAPAKWCTRLPMESVMWLILPILAHTHTNTHTHTHTCLSWRSFQCPVELGWMQSTMQAASGGGDVALALLTVCLPCHCDSYHSRLPSRNVRCFLFFSLACFIAITEQRNHQREKKARERQQLNQLTHWRVLFSLFSLPQTHTSDCVSVYVIQLTLTVSAAILIQTEAHWLFDTEYPLSLVSLSIRSSHCVQARTVKWN